MCPQEPVKSLIIFLTSYHKLLSETFLLAKRKLPNSMAGQGEGILCSKFKTPLGVQVYSCSSLDLSYKIGLIVK